MSSEVRWDRADLRRLLQIFCGPTTQDAAEAFGVSRRTVQRWIGGDQSKAPGMSAQHRAQVEELVRPDAYTLEAEAGELNYAVTALEGMARRRGRRVLPAWKQQGFLEPHMVVIFEYAEAGLHQVATAKVNSRNFTGLRKRAPIVQELLLANRFSATVAALRVLEHVDDVRIALPKDRVAAGVPKAVAGRTWFWLARGGVPKLSEIAVTNHLS